MLDHTKKHFAKFVSWYWYLLHKFCSSMSNIFYHDHLRTAHGKKNSPIRAKHGILKNSPM